MQSFIKKKTNWYVGISVLYAEYYQNGNCWLLQLPDQSTAFCESTTVLLQATIDSTLYPILKSCNAQQMMAVLAIGSRQSLEAAMRYNK